MLRGECSRATRGRYKGNTDEVIINNDDDIHLSFVSERRAGSRRV